MKAVIAVLSILALAVGCGTEPGNPAAADESGDIPLIFDDNADKGRIYFTENPGITIGFHPWEITVSEPALLRAAKVIYCIHGAL